MKHGKKKIEELNLMDDFLFYEAVVGEQGEWFCRLLIQSICQKEVGDIQICPQNIVQGADTVRHGIRMDLYVDESGKCLYDFEPDKYTNAKVLSKRNRYYRALLDGRLLEAGEEYDQLPDMWTIFILPKDPFGRNRMCYTVRNGVLEEPDIEYEDGAVSLFLYTGGLRGGNEELSLLLHYIEHSTMENAVNADLQHLHNYVMKIKQRKEVGVRYMKSWELERMWREESQAEGRAEGLAEGRAKGLAEGREEGQIDALSDAITMALERKGEVSEQLIQKIKKQKHVSKLQQWLGLALDAQTVQQFEKNMEDRG